jgi:hypothetical protein
MTINTSRVALTGSELSNSLTTGSWVTIGILTQSPAIIVFDNQSTAPVSISTDVGTTTWRTFPAGEALVLDLRGNHGIADNFGFRVGTTFSGMGTTGTGNFSISYVFAESF